MDDLGRSFDLVGVFKNEDYIWCVPCDQKSLLEGVTEHPEVLADLLHYLEASLNPRDYGGDVREIPDEELVDWLRFKQLVEKEVHLVIRHDAGDMVCVHCGIRLAEVDV